MDQKRAVNSVSEAVESFQGHLGPVLESGKPWAGVIVIPTETGIDVKLTTWKFPHEYMDAAVNQIKEHFDSLQPSRRPLPSSLPAADLSGFVQAVQQDTDRVRMVTEEELGSLEEAEELDNSVITLPSVSVDDLPKVDGDAS